MAAAFAIQRLATLGTHVGLYTILPLPILYVEWQNRGAGGNHILRNIDCNIKRGGCALEEVLNATNIID